jgi:hypothetical protein
VSVSRSCRRACSIFVRFPSTVLVLSFCEVPTRRTFWCDVNRRHFGKLTYRYCAMSNLQDTAKPGWSSQQLNFRDVFWIGNVPNILNILCIVDNAILEHVLMTLWRSQINNHFHVNFFSYMKWTEKYLKLMKKCIDRNKDNSDKTDQSRSVMMSHVRVANQT